MKELPAEEQPQGYAVMNRRRNRPSYQRQQHERYAHKQRYYIRARVVLVIVAMQREVGPHNDVEGH